MTLTVLGSTGSIGTQALDVAGAMTARASEMRRDAGGQEPAPPPIQIAALAAHRDVQALEQQARRFSPPLAALADEGAARDLKVRLADMPTRVLSGPEGVNECAAAPGDMVLSAMAGRAGLAPTMAAIEAGRDIALANKETLVAGGAFVIEAVRRKGVRLLPVDSEHSAIFQCLQGQDKAALKKIILTASGGAFYGYTKDQLARVTAKEALRHPNWNMGPKVTLDSATMFNKGLELIEAVWLFAVPPDAIDIVIHRQSVVHSLVEFADGALLAQMGAPDMRVPIQYALTYPHRAPSPAKSLDLTAMSGLTFEKPDESTFPATAICREAIRRGGLYPAAVNLAVEKADAAFLRGECGFLDIARRAERALALSLPAPSDIGDVLALELDS